MKQWEKLTVTALLILGLAGCSSESNGPVTPELQDNRIQASAETSSTLLWGLWDVTIDPVTQTAEIVPVRSVEFTANVTLFMQPPSAMTNLMSIVILPDSNLPEGYVVIDVTFKHPFPGLDQFTGFDVRGVCIGNGTKVGVADPNIQYGDEGELQVLNADGLTRWFNPSEFTTYDTIFGFTPGVGGVPGTNFSATLNGYKYFCNGLDKDEDPAEFFGGPVCLNPRGYYSAGNSLTRNYELQFPMSGGSPDFYFQYAVVASWEPPANIPPMDIPDDFPLSANSQEAYCISVVDESEMYWSGGVGGGTLIVRARIFDHQGIENSVNEQISRVILEADTNIGIPGNMAIFDSIALDDALVGQDEISATYLLEVFSVEPNLPGSFPLMIVVESVDPAGYDQGFPGFAWPDGNLAAYFQTMVTVSEAAPPTVTAIDPDSGTIDTSLTGVEVTGTNFDSGAQVTLIKNDDPGVVITATNEVVTGDTLITCDLNLSSGSGVELGTYDVRVTNSTSLWGELSDGFVVDQGTPYWWNNIAYVPHRGGHNPTATVADPLDLTRTWTASAPQYYKYGTPIVAEDKIFYQSHTTYYANTNVRIYAHSLTTGAMLWNAQVNPSNTYQRLMPSYGFYKGSDDVERLLVGGDQIYCFDANSSGTNPTPLWTYDDNDPSDNNWLGTVMCVYEDMVIARGRVNRYLYILDVTDGSVIQRVTTLQGGGESGVSAADGKVYSNGGNWVECIDIETGTVDWSTTVPAGQNVSHYGPPCIDSENGRIYFGSYWGYVQCYAIEDDGTYEPGDHIWSIGTPDYNPVNGGVAKLGDYLFCAAAFSDSHVYCISDNGDSASIEWSSQQGYYDCHVTVMTTPSYPDGVVIAPERSGPINFIDATNGALIRAINDGQYHVAGASHVGDAVVIVGHTILSIWE